MSDRQVSWAEERQVLAESLSTSAEAPGEAEVWKQIANGWFEIRDDGTIWRLATYHNAEASPRFVVPVLMSRRSCRGGYVRVYPLHSRNTFYALAHRLVWQWHHNKPIPPRMVINHINGDRGDNRPNNLEMVTHAENIQHGYRVLNSRKPDTQGQLNGSAKVSADDVVIIRRLREEGTCYAIIGARFGLHPGHVKGICRRRTWKHI